MVTKIGQAARSALGNLAPTRLRQSDEGAVGVFGLVWAAVAEWRRQPGAPARLASLGCASVCFVARSGVARLEPGVAQCRRACHVVHGRI